jgi:hypothetical protein
MLYHKDVVYDCLNIIKYYIYEWLTIKFQLYLYRRGIWWHNIIRGECTPGFECCVWEAIKKEYPTPQKLEEHAIKHPEDIKFIPKKYKTHAIILYEKLL